MEPNARGQTSKNGMALLRYVKWCMFHLLQYSAYLSLSQLDYLLLCCVAYLSLSQLVYLLLCGLYLSLSQLVYLLLCSQFKHRVQSGHDNLEQIIKMYRYAYF